MNGFEYKRIDYLINRADAIVIGDNEFDRHFNPNCEEDVEVRIQDALNFYGERGSELVSSSPYTYKDDDYPDEGKDYILYILKREKN